jgi:hypothetical protein
MKSVKLDYFHHHSVMHHHNGTQAGTSLYARQAQEHAERHMCDLLHPRSWGGLWNVSVQEKIQYPFGQSY